MRPFIAVSTLFAGSLALFAAGVPAQETPTAGATGEVVAAAKGSEADSGQLFIDVVDVNVVNVDVYVSDKDGKPVLGLTKDDFEVFEDGREMNISNFYAVESGRPVQGAEDLPKFEPVPGLPDRLQKVPVPEDQRLHLIVFIDHFNIRPFDRNRVMRELRQFLSSTLRPEDEVMLVSYTRSLKIEVPFTSDPRLVNGAMTKLEKNSGSATLADSERRDVLDDIDDSDSAYNAIAKARLYSESIANDMTFTINALKDFVASLAGLPGRKAILHVSDGLPMVPGEDVFHYIENKFPRSSALSEVFTYDQSRRFQELAALANANRVTFYTIDAGGLRTYGHIDASEKGGPGRGPFIDTVNVQNLQSPLQYMAKLTGGEAILNRNRVLPALQEVNDDFRNYYSLGYSPPHSGDGRLYNLKVEVKGKGLKLRYRENYRDKPLETRMADTTMAALNFGYQNNPLDARMEFGEAVPRPDDNLFTQSIDVRVPLSKLTLVPQAGTLEGRLRIWVSAVDEEGRTAPVQQVPVPISIPVDQVDTARDQTFVYTLQLLMRAGNQRVAVGVRDDLGSDTSFLSRSVRVGA
ncbi:MAG: VWA domain-containing protein [Acidobacteria bacterium]|nr:VWA domain-containing protein [Acidobacteriota bacterium]